MKRIKYKVRGFQEVRDPNGSNVEQQECLIEVVIPMTDENLAKAQAEACNGEYTIEDDGEPEPTEVGDTVTWDELDAAYQEGVDSL